MAIYSNKNITKIVRLSHREFAHLVQNCDDICTRKICRIQYTMYPLENFKLPQYMAIYSNKNITKIVRLSHREFAHLVQNCDDICTRKICRIQYTMYPLENFKLPQYMAIYSNKNITKIVRLSHREFAHLVQNCENICTRKICRIQYTMYWFFNPKIYFFCHPSHHAVGIRSSIVIIPSIEKSPMLGEDIEFLCRTSGPNAPRYPFWRNPTGRVISSNPSSKSHIFYAHIFFLWCRVLQTWTMGDPNTI